MANWLRKLLNQLIIFFCFFTVRPSAEKRGLLLVKLEGLGDFLIFLPSLIYYRGIAQDQPVHLLVDSPINQQIAERYRGLGLIDQIILINSRKFSRNFFYRLKIARYLKSLNFRMAIYQVYYRRSLGDFLIRASGAPERIGFEGYAMEKLGDKTFNHYYSDLIPLPPAVQTEFERNKYFLKQLGAKTENYQPAFPLKEADLEQAQKLLSENGIVNKFAVIFPGAGLPFKRWLIKRFAAVCDYLSNQDLIPVICGSKEEVNLASEIIKNQQHSKKALNLAGQTDIFSLAGLLKKALFYFGNDTGAAHIGVGVDTPALVIMGGGAFGEFFPYGDLRKNRIIFQKDMPCKNDGWKCIAGQNPDLPAPCIEAVTLNQALEQINNLLTYLNYYG